MHLSVMKIYNKHSIPRTCFGHSRGHPQGSGGRWIHRDNTKVCEPMYIFLSFQDGDALHTTCLYHSIHTTNSHKFFICILKFNMYFKPCIFKTQYFTYVHWFTNLSISRCIHTLSHTYRRMTT